MDIQTMISNDDYSTDGKSLHQNTGNNGGKVSEESNPYKITAQGLIIEVKQIQIIQAESIKAQEEAQQALETELTSHQQLKLQLEQIKTGSDGIQKQIETLKTERAALETNSSDILKSCGRCQSGWFLFNTSCYFHSVSQPLKNWQDSRADCISRGADLAMIDTLQEQENLFEYLPKLDQSIQPWWSKPGGIWIGLTDIETEHNWVWVNNVTLQDGGYWIPGEPNNHGFGGPEGEDCVAVKNIKNPKGTWYDAPCQMGNEWLCEMEPN
ncbi:C-type lectin domain family 4 member E-like isoform X2 [Anoplopoma fimbria]|uniref:C-type lectin domain family 4 member E-like isoform X2 n=1 Tax=Anoplopoma fimbria TaxID=229290 RepID=UPI0023EB670A|nr:C-type lectin domain family 4 member E-like isoform X2 [Anoplopoma fimbria]